MATVLLSIFAHGFSAIPGIKLYASTLPESSDNSETKSL
jgi:hypothetical protein